MSKKDYEKMAKVLKDERERLAKDFPLETEKQASTFAIATLELDIITGRIADMLQTDNPRFNREKFLIACGYKK